MNAFAASVYNVANAAGLLEDNLRGASLALPSIAMPQVSMPAMAGATTSTTNNLDLHFGPTTIGDGVDQAYFEERVIQAVRDSIG